MRDTKRIWPILQVLGEIWEKYPDFRLGQLIGNVAEGPGLYYAEDDQLIEAIAATYGHEIKDHDIIKAYPGKTAKK